MQLPKKLQQTKSRLEIFNLQIKQMQTGVFSVNTLVVPFENNKCFIVDPAACEVSGDETKILDYLSKNSLECAGIVLTHTHFDHITGISIVKKAFPKAVIAVHRDEAVELGGSCVGPMNTALLEFFGAQELLAQVAAQPLAERLLEEGDNFFGWKVLHTPGHSPGSICLYNTEEGILLSGDTMFAYGGYGRTDMFGGNEAQIHKSLARLQKEIPSGTRVFPGHEAAFVL